MYKHNGVLLMINKIYVGVIPPEMGPPGERLIVITDNSQWESILVEKPMTNDALAARLEQLADKLRAL